MDDSTPHFCDSRTDIIRIASYVPATAHASAFAPFSHGLAALTESCAILLTKCTSIVWHIITQNYRNVNRKRPDWNIQPGRFLFSGHQ